MADWVNRVFAKSCEDMSEIPDASVHCVVTSPPYWGLRSYGGDEGMIGLEPTVDDYTEKMRLVFREVWRALRPDGVVWLNIGDAFAGSWGAQSRGGSDESGTSTLEGTYISGRQIGAHPKERGTGSVKRTPGMKPKDLMLLPFEVAKALRSDGWYLRSDIVWAKPNPMPSSVLDRPTCAHEYVFLLAKSQRYFYDADAIREDLAPSSVARLAQPNIDGQEGSDRANAGGKTNGPMKAVSSGLRFGGSKGVGDSVGSGERLRNGTESRPKVVLDGDQPSRHGDDIAAAYVGANKRDVWEIATEGYRVYRYGCSSCGRSFMTEKRLPKRNDGSGPDFRCRGCGERVTEDSHFAAFPEALVRPCILAGTSEAGCCSKCGAPKKRLTSTSYENPGNRMTNGDRSIENRDFTAGFEQRLEARITTIGWAASCECGAPSVPCVVLDPFMGTGTTAAVAIDLRRNFVGYEINPGYHDHIKRRIAQPHLFGEPA